MNQDQFATDRQPKSRLLAFKVIAVLLGLVVAESACLVWLFYRNKTTYSDPVVRDILSESRNYLQEFYPDVDFTKVYPDLTDKEIDQLQKECVYIHYDYHPFVQFEPPPQKKRFVTVTADGFRKGWRKQPWPPLTEDFVVFVFGGSTTFSYYLPDNKTVPVMIEKSLSQAMPDRSVQCYNFGRGYFFSTQEKILFESLILQDIIPDVAIFIDGLNDYYYPDGMPQYTDILYKLTDPKKPRKKAPPIKSDKDAELAISKILMRYRYNLKMIESTAKSFNVIPIFVGQPVPFLDFNHNEQTYPFPQIFPGHELCARGYGKFKEDALSGVFGDYFIWCGSVFAQADRMMYADSIHYSPYGARLLAQAIVRDAFEKGLITNPTIN